MIDLESIFRETKSLGKEVSKFTRNITFDPLEFSKISLKLENTILEFRILQSQLISKKSHDYVKRYREYRWNGDTTANYYESKMLADSDMSQIQEEITSIDICCDFLSNLRDILKTFAINVNSNRI